MQQSNALTRLENILTEAVEKGDKAQASGYVLLIAMKLSPEPQNLVDFYELLNKATEETKRLKDISKLEIYLEAVDDLCKFSISTYLWGSKWELFSDYIAEKSVFILLNSLARDFHRQNPSILLEQEFLEKLSSKFKSLLRSTLSSDLSKELKSFLVERIEDILTAIRKYHIDGTEGLKKAAQSLVSDLVLNEHRIKSEDQKNSMYSKVIAPILLLLKLVTPNSIYDFIGAVPDLDSYWIPKFEEVAKGFEDMEQIIRETPTLQEAFEKAPDIFKKQSQKSIMGGEELKALPASKETMEATVDDEGNS